MIEKKYAFKYDGGTKVSPVSWQKYYDTGDDIHPDRIDLKMSHEDDLNRMKKVKSYKGIRHASGHKVRGQRTYSNGRKGLALGVSKRKGA